VLRVVVGAVALGAVVLGTAPAGTVVVTSPSGTVVVGADAGGEVTEVPGACGAGAADCPPPPRPRCSPVVMVRCRADWQAAARRSPPPW
jgi:hypothetical protein